MADNAVDAIVADPPYGFAFMGKRWDYDLPPVELRAEALRVLKPGGHLLAFGGARTYHRATCRIEDAGFEIRDCVMWIYGSGFPKSHNLQGEWKGFGTALKPAHEPIVLARKPLNGTVAENVQTWGCGGLNVDGCRVAPTGEHLGGSHVSTKSAGWDRPWKHDEGHIEKRKTEWAEADEKATRLGRWPANLIHDGSKEVVGMFPQATSGSIKAGQPAGRDMRAGDCDNNRIGGRPVQPFDVAGSSGSAARFFYAAKASRSERDAGLDGMPLRECGMMEDDAYPIKTGSGNLRETKRRNVHPTVKPQALMRYLCRLVTPPNGIILDPFFGSGSTGVAAIAEGFSIIGIEQEADYVEIARRRCEHAQGVDAPLFAVA